MLLLNGLLYLLRKLGLVMLDSSKANISFGLIGNGINSIANFRSAFAELTASESKDTDAHVLVRSHLVFSGEPSLLPFIKSHVAKAGDQTHLNEWLE